MAADVSRQVKSESESGSITRDFLGGSFDGESKDLDLDLHVPSGWEKRLDLQSGKVYIQRCTPANSATDQVNLTNLTSYPYLSSISQLSSSSSPLPPLSMTSLNLNPTLNLLENTSLDLKLTPTCSPANYTSVCTLDKVRSALDRIESASSPSSSSKKRWMMSSTMTSPTKSSSSLSNSSTLSVKEANDDDDDNDQLLVAAACPVCFLYVLISKSDPKCPKCNSFIQVPLVTKKPKIDLNMSI